MSFQEDNNRDTLPPIPSQRDGDDARYQDDRDQFAAPKKGGLSKGCIYGLAGCGCFTVVMIVVLGIGAWKLTNWVKSAMSTDPTVVRATSQEMAEFDPPAGLDPKAKMDMFFAKFVFYASTDGDSSLMLVQIDQKMLGNDKAQQNEIQRSFKSGFQNNPSGPNRRELDIVKSESRDMKIRGQDAKITFAEAKDPKDGKKFRVIKGGFQGKGGPVEFQLQVPEEKYDEEGVVKFLEGIK